MLLPGDYEDRVRGIGEIVEEMIGYGYSVRIDGEFIKWRYLHKELPEDKIKQRIIDIIRLMREQKPLVQIYLVDKTSRHLVNEELH